jgi:hypothetical protein
VKLCLYLKGAPSVVIMTHQLSVFATHRHLGIGSGLSTWEWDWVRANVIGRVFLSCEEMSLTGVGGGRTAVVILNEKGKNN